MMANNCGSVVGVLSQWVEKHSMFSDDPQLIPKLRTFLSNITSPTSLVLSAKQLMQTMDKVVSSVHFISTSTFVLFSSL
jgi:hypothetical protein